MAAFCFLDSLKRLRKYCHWVRMCVGLDFRYEVYLRTSAKLLDRFYAPERMLVLLALSSL